MANKGNGFLTGFTFGLIAGAAGFYLYGTKQGAKVRGQISEEFQKAYQAIPEAERNAYPDSIRGSIKHFVDAMFLEPSKSDKSSNQKKIKSKSSSLTTTKSPKKAKKFKNTKKK